MADYVLACLSENGYNKAEYVCNVSNWRMVYVSD